MWIVMLWYVTDILFLAVLLLAAWQDGRTGKISDRWSLCILGAGGLSVLSSGFASVPSRTAGLFAVSLPLFLCALLTKGGFGGGDIKLTAAGGFFLGIKGIVLAAELAFALGGLYGLFLVFVRKKGRKETFAFGPCLCAGMAAALVILRTESS